MTYITVKITQLVVHLVFRAMGCHIAESQLTIVGLDKLFDEVQSEAGATIAPGRAHVDLLEGPEDLMELVSGDPQAGVGH